MLKIGFAPIPELLRNACAAQGRDGAGAKIVGGQRCPADRIPAVCGAKTCAWQNSTNFSVDGEIDE